MRFTCKVPGQEGTGIEFYRNPFTGSLSIKANGHVVYSESAFDPRTHFGLSLTRSYEFELPGPRPWHVCIVKERPALFAGFRPSRYQVFFNGEKVESLSGY